MILGVRNAKRQWSPEHDKQLREMGEAGKSVTTIALSSNEEFSPFARD
jgi:hypothetical protein